MKSSFASLVFLPAALAQETSMATANAYSTTLRESYEPYPEISTSTSASTSIMTTLSYPYNPSYPSQPSLNTSASPTTIRYSKSEQCTDAPTYTHTVTLPGPGSGTIGTPGSTGIIQYPTNGTTYHSPTLAPTGGATHLPPPSKGNVSTSLPNPGSPTPTPTPPEEEDPLFTSGAERENGLRSWARGVVVGAVVGAFVLGM